NATAIAAVEERGCATLAERVSAAARVQAAGYKVGFHFDPLIHHDGWEEHYRDTVAAVFRGGDTRRVAGVGLRSLRVNPPAQAAIQARPQRAPLLAAELVSGADGKARVWRGLRVKMYRRMLEWLREVDAQMPLYICMEPAAVWERVFGEAPPDREVARRLVAQRV